MHANHLRKFHAQIDEILCDPDDFFAFGHYDSENVINVNATSCSIIYDYDTDFGVLHVIGSCTEEAQIKRLLPSQQLDLTMLAHLYDKQCREILTVLDRYPECFSEIPGFNDSVQHDIYVTSEFKPKRLKPYRVPETLKSEVSRQIRQLLKLGFIVPSKSEMASPIVCVLKGPQGQNGVRITTDFRYVNKHSLGDAYPLSDPSDLIQKMGQARYISAFDARSGYHQTMVNPAHRWLTAFVCDEGLFEWVRTPFGLKGAGYTFVRMLQRILHPVNQFTASFVDDMSVFSNSWEQHLNHVERYLQIIKAAGLTLNLRKSNLAQNEVRFLGHIVGSGRRRADPQKVSAVRDMKIPTTKRQVRQILGFFSFFRDYIPRFAKQAKPLSDLTTKKGPNTITWTPLHQQSFDALKESLCKAAEEPLFIIDWSLPFNIFVDASAFAISGILSQTSGDGTEKPIAFASCKLNHTQQNWGTIEREAFAAIWSLQKFKQWIFGSKITLYSDHNPLTYLTESTPKSSKLMRWSLALQEFNVIFKYKPGRENSAADCLSRIGTEDWENLNPSVAESL
jgi:hypothetical protein